MSYPKIIAVDFDGCLVTNKFPDIGDPIQETIDALRAEQAAGAKVILWTCRREAQLVAAITWCEEHSIRLNAVNSNLLETVEAFGGDTVKVFANEYWDDRAVRMPSIAWNQSEILRIHQEMLDIINEGHDISSMSFTQLIDWFNTIKSEWPWR